MAELDKKFIINLQGKDFVKYEGLLDLAHQNGLKSIEVVLLQMPNKDNNMTAICMATAITESSKYTDVGDASPQSVNRNLSPHIIRMASTRAKARALRDLNNIGMTAIEELAEDAGEPTKGNDKSGKQSSKSDLRCSDCNAEIKQAEQAFSIQHYGRQLCRACQSKARK